MVKADDWRASQHMQTQNVRKLHTHLTVSPASAISSLTYLQVSANGKLALEWCSQQTSLPKVLLQVHMHRVNVCGCITPGPPMSQQGVEKMCAAIPHCYTHFLACTSASVNKMRVTAGKGSSLKDASLVSCMQAGVH